MYLNSHTFYSLKYGTIKPTDLLEMAEKNGVSEMALTDINNTSACLDFVRLSKKYGVRPVLGIDFRNSATQQFVMIARNNKGFQNINEYLSSFLHLKEYIIPDRPEVPDDVYVIYPFSKCTWNDLGEKEFIGLRIEDLNKLRFSKWDQHRDKLVAMPTVSFRNKKDFNAHRLLRAIDKNMLLSKLPEKEQGSDRDIMYEANKLRDMYADFPYLIENARRILSDCSIEFDFSGNQPANQRCYTSNEDLDFRLMRKLCYKGLTYRYKSPGKRIFVRLEKELEIIREKGFVSYFLINWKILKYARSKGYFYVGRGSGANSIVAYLLRITDVDPIELDLYFERFINLYRKNPPDFDIDFSWTDRDDITHFIFNTFPNTALIAVYNTFQYRAAVRELAKVFGLPKEEIDFLSKGRFKFNDLDHLSKLVLIYGEIIQDFPNYLGIHAGGIIISEKPIHYYTPTFMPPKGFPTSRFDMVVAEDIGLYKFDILSQRGLGKIKDTLDIIKYNNSDYQLFDIHDIKKLKVDLRIKFLLKNAKAIGCFYVESPAMRMLMTKLQVDNYLGLVAASSVIRPGVAKSGMMREYILRYRYPERRKDAPPVMLDIMPETFGVMVYQEDVIKVAHYFGGLTLGEADMLRRGMSGKFRSREEFMKVRNRFFDNCTEKGHSKELTEEVWRQIESFAGYAFAKGHSASYAVESYQSLFLKAYYPLEYMVATINNFGGFYRTELYVHEARMGGANICAPCVNRGSYESVIYGKDIYLGFILIKSLESDVAKRIVRERQKNGEYKSLDDFIDRLPISMEQISILIKVNALRFTGRNKRELLWEAHMKINKADMEIGISNLFRVEKLRFKTPVLPRLELEDAFDEMEYLGFPLCSPFDLLTESLPEHLMARDLKSRVGEMVTVYGYHITSKVTRTVNGDNMYFGNFLDLKGDFIDTVHFPPVAAAYPFRGRGVYCITGKVTEEFDCINIEVERMEKMPVVEDPRYAEPAKFSKQPQKEHSLNPALSE